MRVEKISVKRLKSYPDYSNREVGLEAYLDEGEDVKEAYTKLASLCETLLRIEEIKEDEELVKRRIQRLEEYKKRLQELSKEVRDLVNETVTELDKLNKELGKTSCKILECVKRACEEGDKEKKSIFTKLHEKLLELSDLITRIRFHVRLYDDCDDP